MELGIITPQQGMDVLNKGVYPHPEELNSAQKEFTEQRKDGMFNPIVGGTPMIPAPDSARPGDNNIKSEVGRPVGTSGIPQESKSKDLYSRKNLEQVIYKTESLKKVAQAEMKKKISKKRLNTAEKTLLDELCASVIISKNVEDWESSLSSCIQDRDLIEGLEISGEIQDIAAEHDLDLYSAALLFHSKRGL